ncbi:MAG TPA: 3-oxoadipate enol-lactonase [Jatrophihabitans sp.]|jgi:3-oxoadipate enol-lactonase/4-carboxymuconolactone decarboxylase
MKLHARIDGSDELPTLVLVGSVGSTADMWTPALAPLLEQFRIVRIDHRGHGGSQPAAPESSACTLADLGADVLETLDDLGIARAHFAGLSLGAMTGMWLAIHHPERIARLALLCTSAHIGSSYLERAAAVRVSGMAAVVEPVVTRWLTTGLAQRDPELVEKLRAMVASIDAESYAQCCDALGTMDLRPDLMRIAAPTLVVAGADDPATPPAQLQVIADGVPGARLEILADAAHVATYEQPARIAGLLREHFRGGATLERGLATRRAVLGDAHVDRAIAAITQRTAAFQHFLTRYAWGDVWSRDELSRRDRSIATLAALVTLGAEHELAMHVRGARRNGLTDDEIVEVVMHCALYAGLPRANRAVAVAVEVLDESASMQGDSQ